MKLKNSLILFGMLIACMAVCPKTIAQHTEITSEELTQYAQVTAKIDSLKSDMKAKISDAVKSNELMEGGKLYNRLNKAKEDEAEIAEIAASEGQLAAYADIQSSITTYKAEFKDQYTAVVKNEIGAGTYNKVKKALKSDPAIKTQYEYIVSSLVSRPNEVEEGE